MYIICSGEPAKKPYTVKGVGLSIYSIEELCHYIYNNIFDINEDFVDESLLSFLGEELNMRLLVQRLNDMKKLGKKEYEQLILIVSSCDYLSGQELLDFKTSIQRVSGCKRLQRYKLKADSLFKKGRIERALSNYNLIIKDDDFIQGTDIFKSYVYHNLASCQAYSYHYNEAFKNYLTAYKYQGDDRNAFATLMALYMSLDNKEEFMKRAMDYGFTVSKIASAEELIRDSLRGSITVEYKSIDKVVEEARLAMS